MQVYKENSTDARSFPEIWATLKESQKRDLVYELIKGKCCIAPQSVYRWANGKRTPRTRLVREVIAKTVSRVIGAKVYEATLFPNS